MSMDRKVGDRIDFMFVSVNASVPTVLTAGSIGVLNSMTGALAPAGALLATSVNSIVGSNRFTIFTGSSSTFFTTDTEFDGILIAGSVGSLNVAGYPVVHFGLERAPANWAKVTNQATSVTLSATTVGGVTSVATVSGNVVGSVGSVGAVGLVNGSVNGNVLGFVGSVGAVGLVNGSVGGNVLGFVGSVGAVGLVNGSIGGNLTGSVLGNVVGSVGSVGAVGLVNGSVGGNVLGFVGSVGAVGLVNGSIGGNLLGSISATATAAIADKLLGRTITGGGDGGRDVTSALRRVRNRVGVVLSTGTVYEEDDSTPAYLIYVTTAGAVSITDANPT